MRKPPQGYYLILPTEPGFFVSLSIDGATVPLYQVQSTPEKTTCYVESREGAQFAVNFGDERVKRKKGFQASVLIDGQWQRGKNILKDAPPTHWSLGARRDSESTERPFVFGELSKTSQDDVASTSESLYKSLGSIELRYRRIKKCKSRVSEVKGEFDTPEPTTVHEDSKLACLAHQGRRVRKLGPSQIAHFKEERQNKFTYYDSKEEPYHSFVFLYRSREFLESLNIPIVLVPDSPVPSSSPRPQPSTFLRSWFMPSGVTSQRASPPSSSSSSSSSTTSKQTQRRLSGTAETELSLPPTDSIESEKLKLLEQELEELKKLERIAKKRKSDEAFGATSGEGDAREGNLSLEKDGIEILDDDGGGRKRGRTSTGGSGRGEPREEVIVLD
ncbi:hypothetical protein JCM5353_006107 [Sporobolomyces roseus]